MRVTAFIASKDNSQLLQIIILELGVIQTSQITLLPIIIILSPLLLSVCQIVEKRQASIASKPRRTRLAACLKGIALQFCISTLSASSNSSAQLRHAPPSFVEIDDRLSFKFRQPILPFLEPKPRDSPSFPFGVNGPMKDLQCLPPFNALGAYNNIYPNGHKQSSYTHTHIYRAITLTKSKQGGVFCISRQTRIDACLCTNNTRAFLDASLSVGER